MISRLMIASITCLCARDHGNDPNVIARWISNKSPEVVRSWIDTGADLFIARDSRRMVGVSSARRSGEILLLFVSPEAAGAGIGRAMLGHLENWLAEGGVCVAELESSLTAAPFYRRAGWEDVGVLPGSFDMPGHRMRKRLIA